MNLVATHNTTTALPLWTASPIIHCTHTAALSARPRSSQSPLQSLLRPGARRVRSRARSVPGARRVRSRARSVPGARRVRSRARSVPGVAGSAPEPAPSQELAGSAPEPAPPQELAGSVQTPFVQELAGSAPEPAPSRSSQSPALLRLRWSRQLSFVSLVLYSLVLCERPRDPAPPECPLTFALQSAPRGSGVPQELSGGELPTHGSLRPQIHRPMEFPDSSWLPRPGSSRVTRNSLSLSLRLYVLYLSLVSQFPLGPSLYRGSLLRLEGACVVCTARWAPVSSAPPWWAPVSSAPPWWASVSSAPPWWAPVSSAPPWWRLCRLHALVGACLVCSALVGACLVCSALVGICLVCSAWWAPVSSAPPWWAPDLPESLHVSADLPESLHVSPICQSHSTSPPICQSHSTSPPICQSH